MSNFEERQFIVPENWQEMVRVERLRRFNLSHEQRMLEDFQYEDRMVTIEEMITYGKAIMDFPPLYNCYKRVGETHEFDEHEHGLIGDFQEFYKIVNADHLPRYTSWMVYIAGAIRKFGSGRFQSWSNPAVLGYMEKTHKQAETSVIAQKKYYDQFLYLLDQES